MAPSPSAPDLSAPRRNGEGVIQTALFAAAAVSVLTTFSIVAVLVWESIPFFRHVTPWGFLTGRTWAPLIEPPSYGVLPLVTGTLHIVVGSAAVAVPLGLGTAIYLSEYASHRARALLKPVLEVLAGIPTVVYGYFALTFVTPALARVLPLDTFNSLSAALVVGIMVIPTVASISEDAMRAVPKSLREGGYALGATKFEVTTSIVVPSALSGILASFILGISRAVGETMIVTLAAGNSPNLSWNMFESVQTMTAYIVQVTTGDTARGTVKYQTIFAVGLLLFLITLALNIVSNRVLKRYREVYE